MDVVKGRDDNGIGWQFVAAGEDHGDLGCAGGLIRGIVSALGFLDKFVEEGEAFGEIGSDGSVCRNVVVDEFLEESLLHAGVIDHGIQKPGEQGAGGCESSSSSNHQRLHQTGFGQLLALVVSGTNDIIWAVYG